LATNRQNFLLARSWIDGYVIKWIYRKDSSELPLANRSKS
jgi:hypothetical protein